jgi:hypothetical protein
MLNLALDRGEWSASCPGRSNPAVRAYGKCEIGDWVGPSAGLDVVEKTRILRLPGNEPQTFSP